MITIDQVTKRFGKIAAVENASLRLEPGESVALWGSNGAGKTTLIRCVLGLLRFNGAITVGPHDVRRAGKAARMLIGYVPQELSFYDELGVSEAIGFFARLKGIRGTDPGAALSGVGLAGHESKRVRELSGGMKQRLALAIALLGDPPVLVLDEVTASLDAVGRQEFMGLLGRLTGSGRTMLFASHRIEEIATLAQRVVMMSQGKIARVLTTPEFMAQTARGSVLHLMMPARVRDLAMTSLRACGFVPQMNGVGILVPVTPEHKAAPFRVLAEAKVQIDDFEIVSTDHAASVNTRTTGVNP